MEPNELDPAAQPLISYAALERVFSAERLAADADGADPDERDTVARYVWERALVNAIHPVLHTLEVAFRNELARVAGKLTGGRTFRTAGVQWPRALDLAFQKRPRSVTTRAEVFHRFDRIRQFRNRVAHHQAVWSHEYLAQHEYIIESLGWISPRAADALRRTSVAPAVFQCGPVMYRPYAERLLGPARRAAP